MSDTSPDEQTWTHVGEDMHIAGGVTTGSPLSVRGEIVGAVTSASAIEVAEDAIIRGPVRGQEIIVAGTIDGPVVASGTLIILPSGAVNGNVSGKSIQIELGGTLTGRCDMG